MKLTLIRTDRETGKESFSTLEAENLIAKIKKENKAAHVSAAIKRKGAICFILFLYFCYQVFSFKGTERFFTGFTVGAYKG